MDPITKHREDSLRLLLRQAALAATLLAALMLGALPEAQQGGEGPASRVAMAHAQPPAADQSGRPAATRFVARISACLTVGYRVIRFLADTGNLRVMQAAAHWALRARRRLTGGDATLRRDVPCASAGLPRRPVSAHFANAPAIWALGPIAAYCLTRAA